MITAETTLYLANGLLVFLMSSFKRFRLCCFWVNFFPLFFCFFLSHRYFPLLGKWPPLLNSPSWPYGKLDFPFALAELAVANFSARG